MQQIAYLAATGSPARWIPFPVLVIGGGRRPLPGFRLHLSGSGQHRARADRASPTGRRPQRFSNTLRTAAPTRLGLSL
jgi:hypothetical protein